MLAICWAGLALLLQANPVFPRLIAVLGAAYLAWLGLSLMRASGASVYAADALLRSFWAVAWLQLVNPKAWVLITTLAATAAARLADLLLLAIIFVSISCASLALWAVAGLKVARWLSKPAPRLWFDRVMGLLLILSAAALILDSL